MKTCIFEGCEKRHCARGYCNGHYQQLKAGKTLRPLGEPAVREVKECTFTGCTNKHWANGLCSGHAKQRAAGKELKPLIARYRDQNARDTAGRKECSICTQWKPETEYTKTKQTSDGLSPYCKRCYRSQALKRSYNITLDEYEALLARQGGKCAICPITADEYLEATGNNFSVDHDHSCCPDKAKSCGKCVRGLLCSACNFTIGHAREDVDILLNSATYLMGFKNVLQQPD
ncbi:endonuclease VII domain-containing protein [Streptomyces lasalocidi]|uniref:Recombination endonuclease VII n=1 Tax=Streptomyces lasalocidi TaxID=324833 RepID=A0A4U5WMN2_STRLS|nr:hypothetical protein E4U91_27260 [Streptomyces lasalocidi]